MIGQAIGHYDVVEQVGSGGMGVVYRAYDRKMEDILALQDDITLNIVDRLKVQLLGQSNKALVQRHTDNVEAYNHYLKGRYHLNQRTESYILSAIACFEDAARVNKAYALAYAGLAEAYILLKLNCPQLFCERDPADIVERAREAAEKAVELDDTAAEAHVASALVHFRLDWNWAKADQKFRIAVSLREDLATVRHHYAMFLASVNRLDQAISEIKLAHQLDPLSPIISTTVGRILHFARRYDEAIRQYQATIECHPHFAGALYDLGLTYLVQGKHVESMQVFETLREMSGNRKQRLMEQAWAHALMADKEKALQRLTELTNSVEFDKIPCVPLSFMCVALGNSDRAFELLEEAHVRKDSSLVYLLCEPGFDPIRSDPRFESVVQRMNLAEF